MNSSSPPDLPLPQRLALAYAREQHRPYFDLFFALDNRLGQLVAQAREPMLAQIRLAWWRDELGKPLEDRAKGDPILDRIGEFWRGEELGLQDLVSGWEMLLAEPPLPQASAMAFALGRGNALASLARLAGKADAASEAKEAASRWALVDLWGRLSEAQERDMLSDIVRNQVAISPAAKLPKALRPLAVLDGLARRAAKRGNPEMLGSRMAMLSVLRLGMFGR